MSWTGRGAERKVKRVFLIVLDSCGAGALPDAAQFGDDSSVNTLRSCAGTGLLEIPNLRRAGLGLVPGLEFLGGTDAPRGAWGKMAERSMGKDTTIGHWEIAGIVSPKPLPVYPNGFPQDVLDAFSKATGRGVLVNRPYSGTQVIADYGDEQVRTGKFIVYTSADSVFQIAAHEDVVPLEELYAACRAARKILQGDHCVGRVIARPFTGTSGHYTRTPHRHDFSLEPPSSTMLDVLQAAGHSTIAVGKIYDIFAGRGISEHVYTESNADGMEKTLAYARQDFTGLCFTNLVDFDMLYGHRRNAPGYAQALNAFDAWLPQLLACLGPEDLVLITADHGCDPTYTKTTDHTREYVPLLALGPRVKPGSLGIRATYADVAATVCQALGVPAQLAGESFLAALGCAGEGAAR